MKVLNELNIPVVNSLPTAGKVGRLVSFNNIVYYDNGSSWVDLTATGTGGASTPTVIELEDRITPDQGFMVDGTTIGSFTKAVYTNTKWAGFKVRPVIDNAKVLPQHFTYVRLWTAPTTTTKTLTLKLLAYDGTVLYQQAQTYTGNNANRVIEWNFDLKSSEVDSVWVGSNATTDMDVVYSSTDLTKWATNMIPGQALQINNLDVDVSNSTTVYPLLSIGGRAIKGNTQGKLNLTRLDVSDYPDGSVLTVDNGDVVPTKPTNPRQTSIYFEDFHNVLNGTKFTSTVATSGTSTWATPGFTQLGIYSLGVIATAGSRSIATTQHTSIFDVGSNNTVFEAEFRVTTGLDNAMFFLGYSDSTTTAQAANSVGLISDGVTGKFQLRCSRASTVTNVDTGITVTANAWYTMKLVVGSTGATLYLGLSSGKLNKVAENAVNIPTAALFCTLAAHRTVAGAIQSMQIDWIQHTVEFARMRGAQ